MNCPNITFFGGLIHCCFLTPNHVGDCRWVDEEIARFDEYGNRVNPDGTLWNLDGKLAARNQE